MAHLSTFLYELSCEERARVYFPKGLRHVLRLVVLLNDGSFGIAEYAPIIGIHSLSIDEVMGLIKRVNTNDVERYFENNNAPSKVAFPYPLSFLLSMAYFYRELMQQTISYEGQAVELTALVSERSLEDATQAAKAFLDLGFKCLKVKIGALSVREEIEKISHINALSAGKVSLRLDANKRLNFSEARYLASKLMHANIQYIEEPLNNAQELPLLAKNIHWPIAIDESYRTQDPLIQLRDLHGHFLVIKPSRFLGLVELRSLCLEAKELGLKPIFSTCFESEFYSSLMTLFLGSLDLPYAHGLASPGFFKSESLPKGRLLLDDAYALIKEQGQHLRSML